MIKTIGDKIRKTRYDNNMKQIVFATAIGISRAYLSEIESNKKKPGRDLIIRVSKEFNVSLNWLLGIDEANNSISTKNDSEILLLQAFRQLPENEAKMHLNLILQRIQNKK